MGQQSQRAAVQASRPATTNGACTRRKPTRPCLACLRGYGTTEPRTFYLFPHVMSHARPVATVRRPAAGRAREVFDNMPGRESQIEREGRRWRIGGAARACACPRPLHGMMPCRDSFTVTSIFLWSCLVLSILIGCWYYL